jgi:hypothetical protein
LILVGVEPKVEKEIHAINARSNRIIDPTNAVSEELLLKICKGYQLAD